MNFEQQIENGEAAYIHSLIYAPDSRTLQISFMRAEVWVVYGTLTFREVESYRFDYDNEENQKKVEAGLLIDGLLGIHEVAACPNYFIETYCGEITFNSSAEPTWSPTSPL